MLKKSSRLFRSQLNKSVPKSTSFVPRKAFWFSQKKKEDDLKDYIIKEETSLPKGITVEELCKKENSLNNFMNQIYTKSLKTFLTGLGISYALAQIPFIANPMIVGAGFGISIAGLIGFYTISPNKILKKYPGGHTIKFWENSFMRKLSYAKIVLGTSLSFAALIPAINWVSPLIIPISVISGLGMLTASSLYASKVPLGSFSVFRNLAYTGLASILLFDLVGLGSGLIYGPNILSDVVFTIEPYIGIMVFNFMQMMSVQDAVFDYQQGVYDVSENALQFYLNFQNLMLRIIQGIIEGLTNLMITG